MENSTKQNETVTLTKEQFRELIQKVKEECTKKPTGREAGAASIGALVGAGVYALVAWLL